VSVLSSLRGNSLRQSLQWQGSGHRRTIRPDHRQVTASLDGLARIIDTQMTDDGATYQVGTLTLNTYSHEVIRNGRTIHLQPREFRLLEYLMTRAGTVVSMQELLKNVWGYHEKPKTNVVEVHIFRLRRKLDNDPAQRLLHTVKNVGYIVR
jgi:two-component system, OmpR family, response regulator